MDRRGTREANYYLRRKEMFMGLHQQGMQWTRPKAVGIQQHWRENEPSEKFWANLWEKWHYNKHNIDLNIAMLRSSSVQEKMLPTRPVPTPQGQGQFESAHAPALFPEICFLFLASSARSMFSRFSYHFFFGGNKKKEFINSSRIYSWVTSLENNMYCFDVGRKRKTRQAILYVFSWKNSDNRQSEYKYR